MTLPKKKILGIDPGLDRTGWSLIYGDGMKKELLDYGLIHTPARQKLEERLENLYNELSGIIDRTAPDEAAIEEIYFSKKSDTQASASQARGVILLALRKKGLKIYPYNPKTVKKTLTGNGNADKAQMERVIQFSFSLKSPLKQDDISDSVAIAVCHLRTAALNETIKRALEKK